ncbi:MAG TPA: hypothetical protein VKH64_16415, partial [Candidatus Binatia bacterium]|nr:hypothetical protein [Candidatus Binatia bacterium]
MRTASFFCISAALHAAALAYPVFHNAPEKTTPVVVSLVEDEGGGGGENSSPNEKAGSTSGKKAASHKPITSSSPVSA